MLDPTRRESWRSLLEGLPADAPFRGVVHLVALDGHGAAASPPDMAEDVTRAASTALALVQGIIDARVTPSAGVWFVTRGAQVLEQDIVGRVSGELAGATLWGFGKVMSKEAAHLRPRLIDLDPGPGATAPSGLADELLFPDRETHVAWRGGARHAARLVRGGAGNARLALPDGTQWGIGSDDPEAGLAALWAKPRSGAALEPGEVRVAVEAMGLNFADMLLGMGAVPYNREMGREMYGRVLETAEDVEGLSAGDPVVGMGFGSFTPEMVTRAAMVAPAPAGFSVPALATVPICFVTAELAFEIAELSAGERVLVHAGAGGVGLAAVQLARAAGAEVFATASAPKQPYLRSLGVAHVFDSRQTGFGSAILDATGGEGVDVVLNSLTGEGFIEASLSCLGSGGRFVEISKRGIWSEEEMSASRPDIAYSILDLDDLKWSDPARVGASLSRVVTRLSAGELTPLPHTVWPLAEIRSAMEVMRGARHIGKNVLRMPPLARDSLRGDRTYLVTGGLGGIGCAVARWLAGNGAGAIVLNGRRDPDTAALEVIRELRESGADVRVEVVDVTDFAAVDDMLARIDASPAPLGGVVHSVGVLSDGVIENQTWERFEKVLWPKVLGAWHLHQATSNRDLDMFVLFSSVTGVLGNSGQANHAAANAFLDQLAAHRHALGLPGQAIAWGAWSGIGEAEEHRERIERRLAYSGTGWITPEQGIEAFDRLVRQDLTASTVTAVEWSVIAQELEIRPPFLEDLLVAPRTEDHEIEDATLFTGLLPQLRDAPAGEKENVLAAFIQRELTAVLRLASPPPTSAGFFDLGMDSLMAVELRNRLNRAFAGAYTVSNTIVFDHSSIADLARHLAKEVAALTDSPPLPEQSRPSRSRPPDRREHEGMAVVGMACRFPGAGDLSSYWEQLMAGADLITEGRPDFGSWGGPDGNSDAEHPACRWGGYVGGLDRFDARFFGIRPIDAESMDPQQRMLLETSWHALEDAGIDADGLRGGRAGVYAGMNPSEYQDLTIASGAEVGYIGTMSSFAVGRVAFALGLMGPAVPVELNCAASLVAVHEAFSALKQGEVDLAVVGGVNALLSSTFTKRLIKLDMLSPEGRCMTFDASAHGYVRGEGCGIVILKRLGDAEADGDRIWGVIRGSAVNHSGTAAGLMIPSGPAQERVIEDALSRAGIAPSDVDYLEAHGTGSKLGDSIEVQAAAAVYGRRREADRPLLMGTVKTNIGHLESAAGVAGLIKVLLSMRYGVIPKHLHFTTPNPHVDWDRLPVRVASEPTRWPLAGDRPARAGVSAFGLSGTNAHVIVEGYGPPDGGAVAARTRLGPVGPPTPVVVSAPETGDESPPDGEAHRPRTTRLLPLSAKSDGAMRDLARRYLAWVEAQEGTFGPDESAAAPLLSDMAWTAGTGRSHLRHRAAVVFADLESLRASLRALAESDGGPQPRDATNVAFVYAGEDGRWSGMVETLYASEPVVRTVLARCDAVCREERGASLLDVMFGQAGSPVHVDDPVWALPALYALQCSVAALWSSIGIRPSVVVGHGAGELAAARAADVFGLEDGFRLAAARGARMSARLETKAAGDAAGDAGPMAGGVVFERPSLALVSSVTGRAIGSDEVLDESCWLRRAREPVSYRRCAQTLADRGVEVVVEIGPPEGPGAEIASAWPDAGTEAAGHAGVAAMPLMLSSLQASRDDAGASDDGCGFIEAAAGAYEAGLPVSFAGLFAGESRRRIALPGYPFERRRYWIEPPKR